MSQKFVSFYVYCKDCKNNNTLETDEPCNDCLSSPVNEDSHKPIHFTETLESKRKKKDFAKKDKFVKDYKDWRKRQ